MKNILTKLIFHKRKTVPRLAYEISLIWNVVLLLVLINLVFQNRVDANYTANLVNPQVQITEIREVYKYLEPESKEYTPKQLIMMDIVDVFGDKADEAIMIAQCESRFNPNVIGDTHLMSTNNKTGELIGDSIGLFQVRTGDTNWNRANANGMTVDEFRDWMRNPRENIEYAKEIYDRAGSWNPWFNCKNKMLGGK